MKKILMGALMVITSYGAQSQNLWKVSVMPDEYIEVNVSVMPTEDEIKMGEEVMDSIPHYVRHQPQMMGGHLPKPQSIIRKGEKVILIFDRNEFDKFRRWDLLRNKRRLETEIELRKRAENNFIPKDYLERNHK